MNPAIPLGAGIAPAVAIVDGLVYVAFGAPDPMRLELVVLTLQGTLVRRTTVPGGFDQSFPRFDGPWLVYRVDEAHGFKATAYNLQTGQSWIYRAAGATYGLAVNAALNLVAYEWRQPGQPWRIWYGNLENGGTGETPLEGAPDGLDAIVSTDRVTLRKDTRGTVPGIWSPVRAGDLTVGMMRDEPGKPDGGIGVLLAGDELRVLLEGNCADPGCATDGSTYAVVCWGGPGGVRLVLASRDALEALPPAQAVGPRSESRSADGRAYDLVPYVIGDPTTWPRKGPTHPMHQVVRGGIVHFVKFGDIAPGGEPYESWAFDEHWIYHLEDASSGDAYSFTDPRLWPRSMAIGEAHAFGTGHDTIWRRRTDCRETRREPFGRHMWLAALFDSWYWGPDLGDRPTAVLVYDNTGGFHIAGRFIELYYVARGAGMCRWEAHRAEIVYASGQPNFSDASRAARSDFYLLGGPAVEPKLLGCVSQVVPQYPPLSEDPPLKKCEVTVDQFALTPAAHLPDGTVMEFHDRENVAGARVKVWVENGSARMSIDYPGAGSGLKGETGARRPVR